MGSTLTLHDIAAFWRRRKRLILYPAAVVTILCVIGSFFIEKKYESSATIVVQDDELPNPFVNYQMGMNNNIQPEDRIKALNEIVYSESVLQELIDSLHLGAALQAEKGRWTETERQEILKRTRASIATEKPGLETFRITYTDTDPVRAQQAAVMLVRLFIRTKMQVQNQRNESVVQFYEGKLEEMKRNFEMSEHEVVSSATTRINANPNDEHYLNNQIDDLSQKISDIEQRIQLLDRNMAILRTYPEALYTEKGKQDMYDLQRADVPFVDDLRALLAKYEETAARYTPKYPEVVRIKGQISTLLGRIRDGVASEIPKQRKLQSDYERQKSQMVEDLKRSTVTQKVDQAKEATYAVNRGLYDDLKIKLEQARSARDLGRKAQDEITVLDAPAVPTRPAHPNKQMIAGGGLLCGLFLGFIFSMAAEFLDGRIRSPRDLELYGKPIIAFITDGSME